jgi:hypothetical protein
MMYVAISLLALHFLCCRIVMLKFISFDQVFVDRGGCWQHRFGIPFCSCQYVAVSGAIWVPPKKNALILLIIACSPLSILTSIREQVLSRKGIHALRAISHEETPIAVHHIVSTYQICSYLLSWCLLVSFIFRKAHFVGQNMTEAPIQVHQNSSPQRHLVCAMYPIVLARGILQL